jgi:hypothetical protein
VLRVTFSVAQAESNATAATAAAVRTKGDVFFIKALVIRDGGMPL